MENTIATFNSPGDEEESIFVVLAQVTRVQPTLSVQGLLRLVRHVEVAHEDVAAPEADLAVALGVWIVQLRLAPGNLFAAAVTQKKRIAGQISPANTKYKTRQRQMLTW